MSDLEHIALEVLVEVLNRNSNDIEFLIIRMDNQGRTENGRLSFQVRLRAVFAVLE